MDIHKLEIFIDLSETLNYTETAERQFTTQGNISKQIIALEKEVGAPLFERAHRQISLNPLGELLLPHAQEIVMQYQQMQQHLSEQLSQDSLVLMMLTIPTMANYYGFELITKFLKHHPEVDVQLKEGEGNALLPFLKSGQNHVIFARTFSRTMAECEMLLTEEDRFVAVLPKHHPLANEKKIALADLGMEQFVALEEDTLIYQPMVDLCHEAGFDPQISFRSARIDLLLNMVERELGVSLLMEKSIDKYWVDRVAIVPITPTKKSYLSFIRTKNSHSLASQLLWQYIKEEVN
ncbi:LysR family transcriptional regulator [Enterococcus sp.]|uniref:LysR family transcriptional regulator n=1 Tax=Enterococcus sp. TaxID=35783 RepID=UPI0028ABA28C|nr:LysR family transcriptional regulator [Enterococcus sp.]